MALGATSLAAIPFSGIASIQPIPVGGTMPKPDWLIKLIQLNDKSIPGFSSSKVVDANSLYAGAYYDGNRLINPGTTGSFLIHACTAISTPESIYYRSAALLKDIEDAIRGLLALQHSDGTIDLLETNFHSTPDTAFLVKRLTQAVAFFNKSATPGSAAALTMLEKFLKQAGEALIVGGIHTPNHRWVVSAALVSLNNVWPDPRYIKRANDWLAEQIDLDPDGQYTEKSTAGYSAVIDRVLITIALGMKKPELLDAVRKNLNMMFYYLHPNGEVVTEASNRQDKGTIGTMENYYYACRYLAVLDNNGQFAQLCRMIEARSFDRLAGYLVYFLDTPLVWKELPANKPLPVSYAKAFPYSGVVRIRRNEWDCTVLSNNTTFLTFHKQQVMLQGMRIAASFFGKGQFQSPDIKQEDGAWVLTQQLEGVYYQPYPKDQVPADGDWSKMPKTNRVQSEIQRLMTTIRIKETSEGLRVDIDVSGTAHVPVSLELIFRKGGSFVGTEPHPTKPGAYLLKDGMGAYRVEEQAIQFGPGRTDHFNVQLRGALPSMDAPTVYLTGTTPFVHSIKLT